MAVTNRISEVIPAEVITDVTTKLNEIKDLLASYVISLSDDERRALPKMSNKTYSFVDKITDNYTKTNPEFTPGFMNVGELQKDLAVVDVLKPIFDVSSQITGNLDDTLLIAGSEAYTQALLYYASVKSAVKTGVANAKPIYEDLSSRFPGGATNGKLKATVETK